MNIFLHININMCHSAAHKIVFRMADPMGIYSNHLNLFVLRSYPLCIIKYIISSSDKKWDD